jgi:hypothetical protein
MEGESEGFNSCTRVACRIALRAFRLMHRVRSVIDRAEQLL